MLPNVNGAEIRLRFTAEQDQRVAARAAAEELRAKLLAAGALSVKLEEQVITTKRARAPEVARAVSIGDKLDAHWASIGFEPDAWLREALHTQAQAFEQEVAHAS